MATREASKTAFDEMLEARGVTRRTFLKFCGVIAASIGLSEAAAPKVADALEADAGGALLPVVWLEQGSCTGCTESLAQSESPDVATVVLELISLNYSETLSAGAGYSLEEAKKETIEKGGYLLVVEGSIMEAWDGQALRIAGEKGVDIVADAAKDAIAVLAVGSCAVDGGWAAAKPNPGGATGVMQLLKERGIDTPVINLPTCPVNPEWIVSVLVDYLMFERLPELDSKGFPTLIFGETIHDNCPRRGHFENGEFVYKFGSKEEELEYCLYALGCKGPQTYANCPVTRWNNGVSWCVEAGAPCAGCACANPVKPNHNWVQQNTPFLKRHRVIRIGSAAIQPSTLFAAVGGLLVVVLVCHGFGMKHAGRVPNGAKFEKARKWDTKHPDKAEYPETLKASVQEVETEAQEEQAADVAAKKSAGAEKGGDGR